MEGITQESVNEHAKALKKHHSLHYYFYTKFLVVVLELCVKHAKDVHKQLHYKLKLKDVLVEHNHSKRLREAWKKGILLPNLIDGRY